jgi:FkbM family methyltransferase
MMAQNLLSKIAKAGIRRLSLDSRSRVARHCLSIGSGLELVKRNGLEPSAIIDIGACTGEWSLLACQLWPQVPVFMIDGSPENEKALADTARQLGPLAEHRICLLGPEHRDSVQLFQLGAGTSVLRELSGFQPKSIEVPMERLDRLLTGKSLGDQVLIKIDVQGYELEVLKGAGDILHQAEVMILEIALIPYNDRAPLFAEVVGFMEAAGYVAYDFCGGSRRTDLALFQIDVFFVRRDSKLRSKQRFHKDEPAPSVPVE